VILYTSNIPNTNNTRVKDNFSTIYTFVFSDKVSVVRTKPDMTVYSNGSLWLAQTTSKDTGIYTCIATNIAGNVSMVARVTVQGELFSIQIILWEFSNMKQL